MDQYREAEVIATLNRLENEVKQLQLKKKLQLSVQYSFTQQKLAKKPQRDEDGSEYIEYYSSASCRFEDIQGITFGPLGSRFWIYRKHITTMDKCCETDMPFFGW